MNESNQQYLGNADAPAVEDVTMLMRRVANFDRSDVHKIVACMAGMLGQDLQTQELLDNLSDSIVLTRDEALAAGIAKIDQRFRGEDWYRGEINALNAAQRAARRAAFMAAPVGPFPAPIPLNIPAHIDVYAGVRGDGVRYVGD